MGEWKIIRVTYEYGFMDWDFGIERLTIDHNGVVNCQPTHVAKYVLVIGLIVTIQ